MKAVGTGGACYDTASHCHARRTRDTVRGGRGGDAPAGLQHAKSDHQPCCALARRLLRHADTLFQFVLSEGLSAGKNLAQRSVRRLAVIRKVSGGSRSERRQDQYGLSKPVRDLACGPNPFQERVKPLGQTPTPEPHFTPDLNS